MNPIPFQIINWDSLPRIELKGETGAARWQTIEFGDLRMRVVEYSAGYLADHWCQKGHVVYCLKGDFITEQENGEPVMLNEGMTYIVSDDLSSHRSYSAGGVKLLIIDGGFLGTK